MNEYRDSIVKFKREWIRENYEYLKFRGKVSDVIAALIDGDGGPMGMAEERLDAFGDLICRSLDKLRKEDEQSR